MRVLDDVAQKGPNQDCVPPLPKTLPRFPGALGTNPNSLGGSFIIHQAHPTSDTSLHVLAGLPFLTSSCSVLYVCCFALHGSFSIHTPPLILANSCLAFKAQFYSLVQCIFIETTVCHAVWQCVGNKVMSKTDSVPTLIESTACNGRQGSG